MIFKAIILGIIQGLTEFIPVSSSGHLIGIRQLLGWHDKWLDQTFDVALHVGTLVALLAYFWRDWLSILSSFFNHVVKGVAYTKDAASGASGRLLIPIFVACVPAAVVGLLWDDVIENKLGKWYVIAASLVLFGLVMLLAEAIGKKRRGMEKMDYVDYLTIGFAQAVALIPGVSRSGVTISAGLFRGLDRTAAARFSFLLSTPIIMGAALKKLIDVRSTGLDAHEALPLAVGMLTSAIFGYLAIGFLIKYLKTKPLNAFVWYRFAFAALLVVVFVVRR